MTVTKVSADDPRARRAMSCVRDELSRTNATRPGWPERFTVTEYAVPGWLTVAACDEHGHPYIGSVWRVRDDGLVLTLSSNYGLHGPDETAEVLEELGGAPADPAAIAERISELTRLHRQE